MEVLIKFITDKEKEIYEDLRCKIEEKDYIFNYFDYIFTITLDTSRPLEEQLPKKEDFEAIKKDKKDKIEIYVADINHLTWEETETIEECKYIVNHTEEIYSAAEYICFTEDYPKSKIKEYIDKNPTLKEKKLIFYTEENVPLSLYDEIKTVFKDETASIYIKIDNNAELVTFDEYEKTIMKLNEIAESIKNLNLSPFETIMYTYDIVREKVYNKSEDSLYESRDIHTVLFGDKIVCEGYAKLFKVLLKKVGIDSYLFYLNGTKNNHGHVRNEIYLKDEKYNLNGVYFFDSTWDSKNKEAENYFPYTYRFFAKTAEQMKEYDKNRNLKNENSFNSSYDIIEGIKKALERLNNSDRFSPEVISINHMSKVINNQFILNSLLFGRDILPKVIWQQAPNIEQICKEAEKLIDKYNRPIPGPTYLKALYNIRKIQYYNNPEKFPFKAEDFFLASVISKWRFLTPEEKLLQAIFGVDQETKENQNIEERKKGIVCEIKSSDIPKKIKQVEFTKILRDTQNIKIRQKSR